VALQQDLLDLLYRLRLEGHRIAAYGAAAKGATLLNATRVPRGLLSYVVDRNVYKQGRYMPGTHLEIRDPEVLLHDPPAYLLVLAWNFLPEIRRQLADYEAAGGRFIVPVPEPRVLD
jgi:hypothetical protein